MENNRTSTMEQRAKKAVMAFGYVNKLTIGPEGVVGHTIPGLDLPEDDGTLYRLKGTAGLSQDGETPVTNFVLEVSENGADFEPKSEGIDIDVCLKRYKRDHDLTEEVQAAPSR
ncbi:hypothetical protein [Salipiger mucosus]|uniref:Uncharacterized protein n=1 Tax=Salipiger mucosus DSM 16094 TaxID=1123237 RepID=S9QWP6_9RHOB|nr:hypothetical protein [Salipiger mucosus]EPX84028.1 hypothetical protein Salmuc_01803 [Salipiger mucosus DSM 16094]